MVTVADVESTAPAPFDTRTQYVVVTVMAGVVKVEAVAAAIAADASPLGPENHW
jgi:hypothetical protein